ncbi:plexin-B-like isoform X4 [Ostrea edulis]|uniref:plexin-B-like isoform X4 n=1 Tax=Ostrea edulis TaxID=37623 RepID=UPI0024AF07B5|nr:plexin-B-like isoform X4 [Ostrea edulis]XP_055999845.1 plexin-B-like isoform X4 [Ostrea edulis]XP_055999846.1 plexin-B-like isoform X4 [Ostrea edulis]
MRWWVCLCALWGWSSATVIVPLVTDGRGSLSHMVQDNQTLFIGATNYIYQLGPDLERQAVVTTGPQNDSQKCGVRLSGCSFLSSLLSTDNHNKILLLQSDKLVVCGSVFQGKCEIRNAMNISEVLFTGDKAVASNEVNVNTIAFVTQVMNSNTRNMEAMIYVATEFTRFDSSKSNFEFNLRRSHPLVSTKLLEDFSVRGSVEFKTDNKYMKPGLILYVTGFASGNYSYILFNEKNAVDQPHRSKIVHMCRKDDSLKTFLEMPLTCKNNNKTFNILKTGKVFQPGQGLLKSLQEQFPGLTSGDDVLMGLFSHSEDNSSALCIFSMPEVRKTMLSNVKKCLNGSTEFSANEKYKDGLGCTKINVELSDSELLCSNTLNLIIAGGIPLASVPVIQFPATDDLHDFVSLAVTVTTEFTVAFIGSSTGHIRKVTLQTATAAELYDSAIAVDQGHAISQDMLFDSSQMFLYAMSDRKVAKIPVQNCQQYTTCNTCLGSKDPYCGWCTLNHRCTLKSECSNPTASRWQNADNNNCISILNVSPPMAHVSQNITLYLTVHGLPRNFNTSYNCVFDFRSKNRKTVPAQLRSYGIECRNPSVDDLSLNFTNTLGHINITLGIQSVETGSVIVSKPYLLYKCSSFSSCSGCVDNVYWCDWCITNNKCQYNTDDCPGDRVSSRNSNEGKRGKQFCPMVDVRQTGLIFIPKGQRKTIIIQGRNFPEPDIYRGRMFLPSAPLDIPGTRISDTELQFQTEQINEDLPNGLYNANMNVLWKPEKFNIENDGLTLTIYSCLGQAGGDCSFCKNLELTQPAMNCKWCGGKCDYHQGDSCAETKCPGPNVTNLKPKSGHYLGGTVVTITGTNLGVKFTDIENKVTVAGIACNATAKKEEYRPSKRIQCVAGGRSGQGSGPIKIAGVTLQKWIYSYKIPEVGSISPNFAAESGGRTIYLRGNNLNIGNGVQVTIDNNTCLVTSNQDSVISCVVPGGAGVVKVKVHIDGNVVETEGGNFSYVEDPTVLNIDPLKAFESGGRKLTVVGNNFDAIDRAYMFAVFSDGSRSKNENCTIQNSTIMHCPSPALKTQTTAIDTEGEETIRTKRVALRQRAQTAPFFLKRRRRQAVSYSAQLGFYMDNVASVQNLSGIPGLAVTLFYSRDPVIYDFEESNKIKIYNPGIVLDIKGSRLDEAANKDDVKVFVGVDQCNVTSVSSENIYCTPPTNQPHLRDDGKQRTDGIPRVFVVYGNLEKVVGFLRYKESEEPNLMAYIVPAVLGFAGVIIIIVVVVCLKYRKQQKNAEREYKAIQVQLDNLESTVRNECKQAFAELQTDMTDLTTDLEGSKKPYHDYDEYTFRVLFPGMMDHIILQPAQQRNGNTDRHPDVAISHFRQLLNNKQFLLMFIRTLEKQKTFSIRDRANVASLLLILFQNNMEYITQILKALLNDLIEKSIETKRTKIMLRRTESVVEKLLANWLSLCMYWYLREEAGSSLYTLYQSIKVQVDKGPVDCITGEARYSLSQDRLLRTEKQLEYSILTLLVEFKDKPVTKCRVLDCDTITQAKEKMIDTLCRNIPYTQRPSAADLDLEWTKSGKILCDEDSATPKIDGWKQFNTLKYYHVEDGAEMTLLEHQNCRTLPRSPNGSLHSSGFAFTVNREAQPITRTESEVGCKYWHLVKQDDFNTGIKISSEVFLTRLLSTKGTLKKYIDDFFTIILTANESIPPVIKFLFDFLDEAAERNFVEPEVVYNWKCNSVLLRFWVNIIKNPEFVYDINKTNIVDSCLSVVAQAFMDSCSTSDQNLGKDSPSNKLLFAKDIPQYKCLVEKYFQDIKTMPAVSDQDISAYLNEVSRMATDRFTKENALHELYNYVHEYSNAINESLEEDQTSSAQQLPAKLGHVITSMEGPSSSGPAYL